MDSRDGNLYPVKVFTPQGILKKIISVSAIKKQHWDKFDEETSEMHLNNTPRRLKVQARIRHKIDLIQFEPQYNGGGEEG